MGLREPALAYGKQKFTIEEYPAMEEAATNFTYPDISIVFGEPETLTMTTGMY